MNFCGLFTIHYRFLEINRTLCEKHTQIMHQTQPPRTTHRSTQPKRVTRRSDRLECPPSRMREWYLIPHQTRRGHMFRELSPKALFELVRFSSTHREENHGHSDGSNEHSGQGVSLLRRPGFVLSGGYCCSEARIH